jgi:hypothetical protein
MSDSVTPNLGLTIPAHGEAGTWEAEIDNDFVLIDTAIGENAAAISAEASARIATNASLSAAITAETSRAEAAEASCEKTANKSVANGYPSLDGSGKVPIAQIPQIPYSDLTGTPTLGTAAAQPTTAFDAAGSAATVQTNLTAEISRATAAEALKANTSSLATVATSGSYADLTNKPSLGTAAAQSTSAFDAAGTATTAAAGVQTNLTTEVTRATTAEGLLVAKTTTVNGHALSGNVVVSASDLTTGTLPHAQLPALIAADIPALSYDASGAAATVQTNLTAEVSRATTAEGLLVPKATTVNGHALSANVTVSASDLTTGTLAVAQLPTIPYSQLSGSPAIPVASSTAPNMDGTATIGTLTTFAKADHVHPTDTSRVATTTTVNGHALSSNVVVSASDLTTGTLPVGQLPTIPYSQLSGTPAIPSVPITTIQNNGVAVAPVSGVINLVPGANITLTTSGDAVTVAAATTASLAFSGITGGTNTTAAMVVGSGSSLAASGTGTITATAAPYSGLTGTVPTWNQNTTGTASNLSGTPALPNGTTATTQAQADGSAKLATTLYVDTGLATKAATSAIPVVGTVTPLINGTATIGATGKWADSGHIHPTDTSRQAALGYTPVANTVTVNGHALSANVTVSASDITTGTLPHAQLPALVSGDIPANAANTSGSAASFTGTLVGDVTGTQGATVVGKINGTSLAGLSTGILKNTTTTGVPTIAVAGTDYALPNANTSGTAANLSGTPALPNGTTASTQLQADGSMKLATTAYVDTGLATKQASLGYTPVANTVTVNGHALSANVVVSASDITTGILPVAQLPTIPYSGLSGTPAIPIASSTTPNMDGTAAIGSLATFAKADHVHPSDTSRQAALGFTPTNAGIVPSTTPASGQLLIGNAGGTAYAPVSLTGPVSVTAAGVTSVATLNQNTTGSAASFTGSLVGDVTGTQGATVVGKINGTSLAGLTTGLLKNTTTTGVPSIAFAGTDYALPNANTTGTAANLSGTPALPNGTTGTTQTAGDSSTKLATDAFVSTAVANEATARANADALLLSISTAASTYAPLSGTAANLTAGAANKLNSTNGAGTYNWSGQGGQPSWLWGSNDGVNFYVWNPSNFNVNYAASAGTCNSWNGGASFGSSGYQKLGNGLIIQWGYVTITSATSVAITFPIAFPNACCGVQNTILTSSDSRSGGDNNDTVAYISTTGCHIRGDGSPSMGSYWFAVGY